MTASSADSLDSAASAKGGPDERPRLPYVALAGTATLVGVWFLVSWSQPEVLVPSPAETIRALIGITARGELHSELATTVVRAAAGTGIALLAGTAWGLATAYSRPLAEFTQPARGLLLGMPPVIPLVIGAIWLGNGGGVAILVVVAVTLPTVTVTIAEGARGIDRDLLEMARVHEVPLIMRLRQVILPALAPALRASWSLCCGAALRITIVVELVATTDGIGAAVALARGTLETADVFAWALVAIVVAIVFDRLITRPSRGSPELTV